MKKNVYLLAVLMIALSCVCWTGCSDSDDGPETPPEIPGDTIPPVDTIAPIDTVYQVKSIRMGDPENEGFYTQITLTRTNGKVTNIVSQAYAPGGQLNGPATNRNIDYKNGKVLISYDDAGYDKQMVYALDANGYVIKMEDDDISVENDPYVEMELECKYDLKNGMLQEIYSVTDEVNLFEFTFDAKNNWANFVDGMNASTMTCKSSENLNNYTIDLNFLAFVSGNFDLVDYAVWLGLFPNTPYVLSSMSGTAPDEDGEEMRRPTKAGEQVFVVEVGKEGEKITSLKLKVGDSPLKIYTLGY